MQDERERELFFGVFEGLAQLAPGSREETLRALGAVRGLPPAARVLDAGCGRGAQTRVLAGALPGAHLLAVDDHVPFLQDLRRDARAGPGGARLTACAADVARLPFRDGCLDLVWAEGAIYVVGLERGLGLWRPLLRPGGWIALTELAWLRPDPPAEALRREHPDDPAAARVAGALEREIGVWRHHGDSFGYVFFIAQRTA